MNIDPTTYGYQYDAAFWCPVCIIEVLIAQGKASPAAREIGPEVTIEQIQQADAASTMERLDSDRYPQRLGAYSGLTERDVCDRCGQVLYA